jgi:diphosphomevalonate decarboxylase
MKIMSILSGTAVAHPNIAFIKYWGNRNSDLRIPANSSLSMNLANLETRTQVTFSDSFDSDRVSVNGKPVLPEGEARVRLVIDLVRGMAGLRCFAEVTSQNNFPTGAGIASSASAFAALSLAASTAAGLNLDEPALSRLARRGSGSACRSIPAGFVEWQAGSDDDSSYAFSIAPPEHWDLMDCIAITNEGHKPITSSEGHKLAITSQLQSGRLEGAAERVKRCRTSILERDFEDFAAVVELDSDLMHAVMMTSNPPLLYWQPATIAVMHAVRAWRKSGLPVCYSIDAGPNVHVLCQASSAVQVQELLGQIPGVVQVLPAGPGGAACLVS